MGTNILGLKEKLGRNILGTKTLCQKQIWDTKPNWVQTKNCVRKKWVRKKSVRTKFGYEQNLSKKKNWVPKNRYEFF